MSFEFDIDPKEAASAEFMTRVHRVLLREMTKAAREKRISRADVARILNLDKSVVTRALNGTSNLTIRTVSDLCWAIGVTPELEVRDAQLDAGCNVPMQSVQACIVGSGEKNNVSKGQTWAAVAKREQTSHAVQGGGHVVKVKYAH